MSLSKSKKAILILHLLVSMTTVVFLFHLLDQFVYKISFAYYYSATYELIFRTWTVLSCLICIVVTLIPGPKFSISKYLFTPVFGIVLYKLSANGVTLLIYGTQQQSFDLLLSMGYLMSCYVLLSSLKAINNIVHP